ncbi:hypothetical protein MHU86_17352 [Fragilaria crotonensis]|nr:hypothetical protein MHU86_17352 [Fragilaria crotonensis]
MSNVDKHTKIQHHRRRQPENVDLLSQIRAMKCELGIRVSTKWVKGHQTAGSIGNQSPDVARNNRADELATWFRENRDSGQSREKTDHVPEERVSVRINGIRQVGKVEDCIRFHINGYHLRSYLQARNRWSNRVWDMIDFKVLGMFCRSLSPAGQVAQTELMYDQRHTGIRRYRVATIKNPTLLLCPCCSTTEETSEHVLQCHANPGRHQAITNFRKTMDALGAPLATRVIKSQVLGWLNQEIADTDRSMIPSRHLDTVEKALHQQQQIGWSAALRGILAASWSDIAARDDGTGVYDEAKGSQTMRKVTMAIHTLSMQLWKARNSHLHNTDKIACRQLRYPEFDEITRLHEQVHMVNASDRHFCERPLEEIINARSSVRRRWLQYMRKARERFEIDGSKKQMMMTDFFRVKGENIQ